MALITRRTLLTGSTFVAAGLPPRKPWAARSLPNLADVLVPTNPPARLPDAPFFNEQGQEYRLTAFLGRGMVVNLWATWCAPCVAEMPSFEALSRALAPHDIAVLPLSSDRGGADTVRNWFRDHDITALPVLLDPKGTLARAWDARGLPMTVIVDREGREQARLEGPADWSTQEAIALVRKLVG